MRFAPVLLFVLVTAVPDPGAEPVWLVPGVPPQGLQVAEVRRERQAHCGLRDCLATMPTATIVYQPIDAAVPRTMTIRQSLPAVPVVAGEEPAASERQAGRRLVRVVESSDAPLAVEASWVEPGGIAVRIDAFGISWAELADVIAGLSPAGPGEWPVVVPHAPVGRCVDARSQLVPDGPAGWLRFVIQAQPTGGCDNAAFLQVSFVRTPGPGEEHGTLITVIVSARRSFVPTLPSETIDVGGRPGRSERFSNGQEEAARVVVDVDTVTVDASGNAPAEQLAAVLATLRPVDGDAWAELVAAVGRG